jgi:glycosyltransferase involved in cell wall biosynthesis
MRILLPIGLDPGAWLGGANYFHNLLSAVSARPAMDVEVVVATNLPDAFAAVDGGPVRILPAPWLRGSRSLLARGNALVTALTRYNALLVGTARRERIDLVSHWPPGRGLPCPALFWMPDFQHRYFPEFFSRKDLMVRDRNLRLAGRSGHLLVSSEAAASDFRRFYPESGDCRVHVLHFVPDVGAPGGADGPSLPAQVPPDYLFLPNQFWRHKNHEVVLEALARLPGEIVVVCTGAMNDYRGAAHIEQLLGRRSSLGLDQRFLTLGTVSRDVLFALMRSARAIVNPSLFEGWSSTVEEGKALGKQLVLSDLAVHREQAPRDALYFDPQDPEALAQALRQAWNAFDPQDDRSRSDRAAAEHPGKVAAFAERYLAIARAVAR